jgi:stringent starvation protein B
VRTVFNTHVRFAGRVGACASPVVMDLQAKYAAFARGNGAVGLYLGMESKNRMGEIIRQL